MFWTCMLLWSFKTKVTSSIRSFHWTYRNNNFSFSHMFYYFINFILLIFNIIYTSHIALVFKFSKPEYNLFEKSHHLIMCALRVLPKNTPLPVAVGSGNYSAGNFPAHPQPAGPQAESQASDERKIHFSPSLRTCAESQSGTSALRQVYGSVVNGSCVGGWAENTSRVGDLRRGVAVGWRLGGSRGRAGGESHSLICSLSRFNHLVRPFAPYQRFI